VAAVPRTCVYCGSVADLTRDHIPPKSLFKKPRPPNLITVWACAQCNKAFSNDDDYFWLTLSSRAEATENSEARDASLRAIQHLSGPEASGFRAAFSTSFQSVELRTASGAHVGDALAYDISFPRLNRVAARITRGLFSFESKALLASGYVATARALEGFTPEADNALQPFLAFIGAAHPQSIGKVFSYRFRSMPDDPASSLTLFEIYETTAFLGLTIKGGDNVWTEWV
jgi:hypothetical protein